MSGLNLLFITADQWRGDCLSALGHPAVKTPVLDALARDGVLFARHYANAAPCGPSRATLHTGLYLQNHRSGTNGTPLDARHTNWALELRQAGHDPVLFGYTDTSRDPRAEEPDSPWLKTYEAPLPGLREICHFTMGDPSPWTDRLKREGFTVPAEPFAVFAERKPGPDWEDGAPAPRPLLWPAHLSDTAFLTDELIGWIGAQPSSRPWAAHLSLLRPHPPFAAPEPYNAMYDPAALPGFHRKETAEDEAAQHPWLAHQLTRRGFRAPQDVKKLRRMKAAYYGLMSEVDANLGRLFSWLKETGRYERTLILFTSDHGEEMGDHWLLGKGGYFDGSYHIPLIIRDPRKSADETRGRAVTAFTEHVDIAPTLLSALGLPVPPHWDGASLLPFIERQQGPAAWRGQAHWEFDFRDPASLETEEALGLTLHQCTLNVLRGPRYKYVHFPALPPLLFDLEEDPHEMRNLAEDPAHLPVLAACAQKLLSWRMLHDEQRLTHIALTPDGPLARPAPRY